jgi:hypothetical protein
MAPINALCMSYLITIQIGVYCMQKNQICNTGVDDNLNYFLEIKKETSLLCKKMAPFNRSKL